MRKYVFFIFLILFFTGLTSYSFGEKVNLNRATVSELMTLPYIGEKTANDIIEYRERHRGFKSIEELKAINGIGEKKYQNLKGLITIKDETKEK